MEMWRGGGQEGIFNLGYMKEWGAAYDGGIHVGYWVDEGKSLATAYTSRLYGVHIFDQMLEYIIYCIPQSESLHSPAFITI